MFPQMTLLDALPGEETSAHLYWLWMGRLIFFPGLDDRCNDTWICRPFSVNETAISDGDVAKIEFLQLREDPQLRIDFTEEELPTFWAKIKNNCPLLSLRALTMPIESPSTNRCEAGFSAMVTLKTKARNGLLIDADMRCCLSSTAFRFAKNYSIKTISTISRIN